MLNNFSFTQFSAKLDLMSEEFCKTVDYLQFTTSSVSAYLLVTISLDRMINIVFPRRSKLINKTTFQISAIVTICSLGILCYIPVIVFKGYYVLEEKDDYNQTYYVYKCEFRTHESSLGIHIFHMVNTSFLPFSLMISSSIITIISIAKSRSRLKKHNIKFSQGNKNLLKDYYFAVTSTSLNILFLVLSSPLLIANVVGLFSVRVTQFLFSIVSFLFYSNYCSLFFISYFTNSIFREEFGYLIRFKRPKVDPIGSKSNN